MNILITGGSGFIGRSVIEYIINNTKDLILNVDCLTYAGNVSTTKQFSNHSYYQFSQTNICDYKNLEKIFLNFAPDIVMHLAAESHVDRSITKSKSFIETNIIGTYNLLEISRYYWENTNSNLRFHHISTDEVYGDLKDGDFFTETTPYAPSSPYSASKASSDHLVRAWLRTYGLPTLITHCSNNYGPYQYPEKLIPSTILNAIRGRQLPIYGNGQQIRDWLYVTDHAQALYLVATEGKVGETYNISGHNQMKNIDVVKIICDYLQSLDITKPNNINHFRDLITYVKDRPGHDTHYAINANKILSELNYQPKETFELAIIKTINWYLNNRDWWQEILQKENS